MSPAPSGRLRQQFKRLWITLLPRHGLAPADLAPATCAEGSSGPGPSGNSGGEKPSTSYMTFLSQCVCVCVCVCVLLFRTRVLDNQDGKLIDMLYGCVCVCVCGK